MVNGIMAWNGDSNWTDISPLYLPPSSESYTKKKKKDKSHEDVGKGRNGYGIWYKNVV